MAILNLLRLDFVEISNKYFEVLYVLYILFILYSNYFYYSILYIFRIEYIPFYLIFFIFHLVFCGLVIYRHKILQHSKMISVIIRLTFLTLFLTGFIIFKTVPSLYCRTFYITADR